MAKKILIAVVAVTAGLLVLSKTKVGSYACMGWKECKSSLAKQVPPELEIKRLRQEMTKIDPLIDQHISQMATDTVQVENLRRNVEKRQVQTEGLKQNVAKMTKEVESGDVVVSWNGGKVSRNDLKKQLEVEFTSFKRSEATLKSQQAELSAREDALKTARLQLKEMQGLKDQLEAEIAQIEADLKTVRLEEIRNKNNYDTPKLGEIKESIAKLKTDVETRRVELELKKQYIKGPSPEGERIDTEDLLKEIKAHPAFKADGKAVAEK